MRLGFTVGWLGLLLVLESPATVQKGTVAGTVAAVTENREFVGIVARAVVQVECGSTQSELVADDNGDFLTSLPVGRYKLVRLLDANRRELRISSRQSRFFEIKKNKHTRFDVMVWPMDKDHTTRLRSPVQRDDRRWERAVDG